MSLNVKKKRCRSQYLERLFRNRRSIYYQIHLCRLLNETQLCIKVGDSDTKVEADGGQINLQMITVGVSLEMCSMTETK